MPDLAEWVVALVERFGYAGIAALVALESFVPPIPSEVVLPMAGFAAAKGVVTFWGAVVAATVGSLLGAFALYAIAWGVGEARIRAVIARYGRWVLLAEEDVDKADAWFARHGRYAVLFGRLVPGVRSFVSLPAGAARMHLGRFTALTAMGSATWNVALLWVGYELGVYWEVVAEWIGRVGSLVWVALGLVVLAFVAGRLRKILTHRRARRT